MGGEKKKNVDFKADSMQKTEQPDEGSLKRQSPMDFSSMESKVLFTTSS